MEARICSPSLPGLNDDPRLASEKQMLRYAYIAASYVVLIPVFCVMLVWGLIHGHFINKRQDRKADAEWLKLLDD